MKLQPAMSQIIFKNMLSILVTILLFLVGMGHSIPAQAATALSVVDSLNLISSERETEVLQIIRRHPEIIVESLQAYERQQQERQNKAKQIIFENIRNNVSSFIQGSPTTGTVNDKVVLIEFSDFQCPFCAQAHNTLNEFMKAYQDSVALVYKHFPLNEIHPEATSAARAAWAASQQGKFWQYHDALFTQQDKLGEQLYLDIAESLNLDMGKFNKDRTSDNAYRAIQQDVELAEKLGVQGTPFFVMNGRVFEGAIPLSVLEQAL